MTKGYTRNRTGCLINTDDTEYQLILAERNFRKKDRIHTTQVLELQNNVAHLTSLVERLLNERTP